MELSRIAQQHIPALVRSERSLVAALPNAATPVAAERYERQMKELADARAFMKQVPDKKSADRQDRAEKVRMLKERLRMLKQMIPFMSPAAAKSLKAELRQLAAQLAALAADGSGGGTGAFSTGAAGGSGSTHTAVPETAPAGEAPAAEDAPGAEGSAAHGAGTQGKEAADSGHAEPAGAPAGNRQTQEELEELKRLYRSVRAMVQRKLQQAGDRSEPLPNGPAPLTVYAPLPEIAASIRLRA